MVGLLQVQALLYLKATNDLGLHLILDIQVNFQTATALVDSGATGIFMHPKFVWDCKAEVKVKVVLREIIDGRIINSKLITHEATVELKIGRH